MNTCPACSSPMPVAAAPTLVELLGRFAADGATTEELARLVHNRTADARTALRDLAEEGIVERLAPEGRSHAQRWRLTPPGRAPDAPPEPEPAEAGVTDRRAALDVSEPHAAPRVISERLAALGLLAIIALALTAGASLALVFEGFA